MMPGAAVVPAVGRQTASIIFLHGLGDSGHGWADILSRYRPNYAKLICPHAPSRPVTINGGYVMPAWWDIKSLDKLDGNEDEEGIKKAAKDVEDLIRAEVNNGIPESRIVLGGFSQGAATALYTGLTSTKFKLAGLVALSGYLPLRNSIQWDKVNKISILQCHGKADDVVPYPIGVLSNEVLKQKLTDVRFRGYEGLPHSSCPPEMEEVNKFFNEVLPPQED